MEWILGVKSLGLAGVLAVGLLVIVSLMVKAFLATLRREQEQNETLYKDSSRVYQEHIKAIMLLQDNIRAQHDMIVRRMDKMEDNILYHIKKIDRDERV